MDLQTRKLSVIEEIIGLDNEKILASLENLLNKNKREPLNSELKPMSIKQFNKDIDESLEDSKHNRVTSATDLRKEIETWH